MSLEAWGDEGGADDMYTQDAVDDLVAEAKQESRLATLREVQALCAHGQEWKAIQALISQMEPT